MSKPKRTWTPQSKTVRDLWRFLGDDVGDDENATSPGTRRSRRAAPSRGSAARHPRRARGAASDPGAFSLPPPGAFSLRALTSLYVDGKLAELPAEALLATDWIIHLCMEQPDDAKRIATLVMAEVRKALR